MQEDHHKPIYCICFNHVDPNNARLFASVAVNRVRCPARTQRRGCRERGLCTRSALSRAAQATIYEAQDEGGIVPLQAYSDEDVRALRATFSHSRSPLPALSVSRARAV